LRVQADLIRLAQVLANLLNNAAKYTEEGGRIALEVAQDGDEAIFRVRDNGIGIAPEIIASVFDLFTQIDRSLDRSQGGLGVGLTLVRQLVELHGGSVAAHSEGPNRGSEFVVRLPALPEEPPLDGAADSRLAEPGNRTPRRLLIVEDD
jgi:signal transduction histidine kinase